MVTRSNYLGTRPRYAFFKPDHLTGSDAAELNCQGTYRLENRSLWDNVPARLGYGPCWTNEGNDENELGTFLHKAFIYNQARKGMWHSEWGL